MLWRNHFITGIEIGTNRVTLVHGKLTGDGLFEVLGSSQQALVGVRKGTVLSDKGLTDSIDAGVTRLFGRQQKIPGEVLVTIDGDHCQANRIRGVLQVPSRSKEPIHTVLAKMLHEVAGKQIAASAELLDAFPATARIAGDLDPQGKSIPVECEGVVLTTPPCFMGKLDGAFRSLGIKPLRYTTNPLSTSELLVDPSERAHSHVFFYVGEQVTTALAFDGGLCRRYDVFPIGNDYLASDVAFLLQTNLEEARKLVAESGTLIDSGDDLEQLVSVPGLGQGAKRKVSLRVLHDIMAARALEISLFLKDWLHQQGYQLTQPVTIGGTILQVPGALPFIQRVIERPVECGSLPDLAGARELFSNFSLLPALGVCFQHKDLLHHTAAPVANVLAG